MESASSGAVFCEDEEELGENVTEIYHAAAFSQPGILPLFWTSAPSSQHGQWSGMLGFVFQNIWRVPGQGRLPNSVESICFTCLFTYSLYLVG